MQAGYTSLITNADHAKIYYGGCSVNISVLRCVNWGLRRCRCCVSARIMSLTALRAFLEAANVPLDGITVLESETTSSCYLLQDNQNNHITIFYPGAMAKKYAAPAADELFANARLGIMTVASKPDNEFFLRQCQQHHVPLAFGMKDDFDAFPPEFLTKVLRASQFIFMNEKERSVVEDLLGCDTTKLITHGDAIAIITTLGECGSVCYTKNDMGRLVKHEINVCPVEKVVDATGAGGRVYGGFPVWIPERAQHQGVLLPWGGAVILCPRRDRMLHRPAGRAGAGNQNERTI